MSEKKSNPYAQFGKEHEDKMRAEVSTVNQPVRKKRQRKEKTENTTYTLTPTHKKRLSEYAKSEGVSASQIIREWIEEFC